ncbi:MAG: hypothetical protein IPJ65_40965 [Archangiaceae bacterium]|nr:hypothetical protein [Archangiaceae bacterium]
MLLGAVAEGAPAPRVALVTHGASEAEREVLLTRLQAAGLNARLEELPFGPTLAPLLTARAAVALGYQEARRLFFDAKYPLAKKRVQAALLSAAGWEGDPQIARDLARLWLVAAQAGDEPAWARAAATCPTLELEEAQWSPEARQRLQRAVAGLGAREATLQLETTPAGAEMFVDGAPVGVSPLAVEVSRGPHAIFALYDGHLPASRVLGAEGAAPIGLSASSDGDGPGLVRLGLELGVAPSPDAANATARALRVDAVVLLDAQHLRLLVSGEGMPAKEIAIVASPRLAALRAAVEAATTWVSSQCALAHTPPEGASGGKPLRLAVDAGSCLETLRVVYRELGAAQWSRAEQRLTPNGALELPALRSSSAPWVLEYALEALTHQGWPVAAVGSERAPLRVPVSADLAPPPLPFYRRAWFWGVVGVLVAGGLATGLGFALAPNPGTNVNL